MLSSSAGPQLKVDCVSANLAFEPCSFLEGTSSKINMFSLVRKDLKGKNEWQSVYLHVKNGAASIH